MKVIYGKDGEAMMADEKGTIVIPQKEQKEPLVGGTITITQEKPTDGKVRVNFTVAPASGYTYTDGNITLVAFIPLSSTRADSPAEDITVHRTLTLTPKDKSQTDTSKPRDYYVDIDEGLGLWVQSATFEQKNRDGEAKTGGYSGVYYLNSRGQDGKNQVTVFEYYLCPTEGWCYYVATDDYTGTDNGQPFITTYKCKEHANDVNPYDVRKAIWIIEKANSDYYYIKHALDGKYLVYNGQIKTTTDGKNRCRVHIESMATPDNNALFKLLSKGENRVAFQPINAGSPWVLTVNQGNYDYLDGTDVKADGPTGYKNTGGIVGIWSNEDDINSPFYLEDAVQQPVISQATNGDVTITCATSSTTIYYTLDGSNPVVPADGEADPTGPTYKYTSTFSPALGSTGVKAVAVLSNLHAAVSKKAERSFVAYSMPTFSFDGIDQVTISASHADATIYYTTNGDAPVVDPSLLYDGTPLTVSGATTVKAIAAHTGFLTSDIATFTITQVATPTIQNNGNNAISITCATEYATIYYTTDGSTPTTSSNLYTTPLREDVSGVTIKAIAVKENMLASEVGSGSVTLQCEEPVIKRHGNDGFTITCPFPASGTTIYYTTNGDTPTTNSSSTTSGGIVSCSLPVTVKAFAVATNYDNSTVVTVTLNPGMGGDGSAGDPYTIEDQSDVTNFINEVTTGDGPTKHYKVISTEPLNFSGVSAITQSFSGTFDGGLCVLTGLTHALFNTVNGGTVKNVILKNVGIQSGDSDGDAGAICNKAEGATIIYNCGILPTTTTFDDDGNITGFTGSTISGNRYVGSLVGLLDGTSRVINCYSFATVSGGTMAAGIVGNNNQTSSQDALKTIVVNCMFYGDISGGTGKYPVYGGNSINNDADDGINPYCYFRKNARFTPTAYNRSWPAEEKNLKRFEYYRSILNSNRRLCTWWVNGTNETAPTDNDVSDVGIAKWVLDPSIAPYPILKAWGYYPSVINLDKDKVWDPRTKDADGNPVTPHWVQRSSAKEWEGKSYGTLPVTIYAGSHGSGSKSRNITITDMDTLNCDYGYYKIQLPYYNEVFGNPNGATHEAKYANNYTAQVVTGWMITSISGGTSGTFTANWETGYNFADRDCTDKDLYSVSGRVFAQGGYYYVPKSVTGIEITAKWGKAVYLTNRGYSIDRVNVTNSDYKADKAFASAGTVDNTFHTYSVYDDWQDAIKALNTSSSAPTVYDQAIVLIGNHQVKNGCPIEGNTRKDTDVSKGLDSNWHPFTMMSADLDFDNEPDNCFQLQFRNNIERPGIQPVRFDFLPIIELGLAVRHDKNAYAIGIMVPQGHFEITETAFMRTTQFEYDGFQKSTSSERYETKSPVIINGGEFEMFTVRYHSADRTSYFLLGGNAWIHRFAPGAHPNTGTSPTTNHCAVNVIGGEIPELYLSGLYRPELTSGAGAPHCYTNGGKFGIIAGAGYDKVADGVTFKVNHSLIGEFYGGGINGSNAIPGNIDVTIDYSRVAKYCGGPKVGDMTGKTVTTHATGTTFGVFYGSGNGGNSYYRDLQNDGDQNASHISDWLGNYNWGTFNPLVVKDDGTDNKGYHAEYEFEVFNQSNGLPLNGVDRITQRGFIRWIQFGLTKTGNTTNILDDCTITTDFYGGGNLGTVVGFVTSTLTGCTVKGSAFGAGYSAAIPTFQVHNKDSKNCPSIDDAGIITPGHIDYDSKVYEWTNDPDDESHNEAYMKEHPTYQKDGKWYCYTWNSLDNLGAVSGNVTLTLDGSTVECQFFKEDGTIDNTKKGGVYGGGDASGVTGSGNSVTVNLKGNTTVNGNVFGGGNKGIVEGSATVNIVEQ